LDLVIRDSNERAIAYALIVHARRASMNTPLMAFASAVKPQLAATGGKVDGDEL
jgi:hypothetical protein